MDWHWICIVLTPDWRHIDRLDRHRIGAGLVLDWRLIGMGWTLNDIRLAADWELIGSLMRIGSSGMVLDRHRIGTGLKPDRNKIGNSLTSDWHN